MITKIYVLIVCLFMLAASGCQQNVATVETAKAETIVNEPADTSLGAEDACGLISASEIETMQGKKINDAQSSSQTSDTFIVSQCYYMAAENANSVVLSVYRADPVNPNGKQPKKFWQERFSKLTADDEAESESKAGKSGKEKEEESTPPEPIKGLGDQAYWLDNKLGGALYVLKGDEFIRISVGGIAATELRINKAKSIAEAALKRL